MWRRRELVRLARVAGGGEVSVAQGLPRLALPGAWSGVELDDPQGDARQAPQIASDLVQVTGWLVDVESGAVLTAVKVDGTIDALSAGDAADSHGAGTDAAGRGRPS